MTEKEYLDKLKEGMSPAQRQYGQACEDACGYLIMVKGFSLVKAFSIVEKIMLDNNEEMMNGNYAFCILAINRIQQIY